MMLITSVHTMKMKKAAGIKFSSGSFLSRVLRLTFTFFNVAFFFEQSYEQSYKQSYEQSAGRNFVKMSNSIYEPEIQTS